MDHSQIVRSSESELVRRALSGDQAAFSDLLSQHRDRLRRMVTLRLDRRLRGRVDASDIIQEAYIDAAAGLPEHARRGEMSFFRWLRWLTGMKIHAAHRKHLGFQVRDAGREISIERGVMPQATSAATSTAGASRSTSC